MSPTIVKGYRPGALGRIAELHGVYYHQHAGFGLFFRGASCARAGRFSRALQR
jgi:hypothetical protein